MYQKYTKLESFIKNDDIMCLEYISEENQLLPGADSGNILNHDITHYIFFEEREWPMLENGEGGYDSGDGGYDATNIMNSELE